MFPLSSLLAAPADAVGVALSVGVARRWLCLTLDHTSREGRSRLGVVLVLPVAFALALDVAFGSVSFSPWLSLSPSLSHSRFSAADRCRSRCRSRLCHHDLRRRRRSPVGVVATVGFPSSPATLSWSPFPAGSVRPFRLTTHSVVSEAFALPVRHCLPIGSMSPYRATACFCSG